VELRKQAEQFVEPGFKLVMQVRTRQMHTGNAQEVVLYASKFCRLYLMVTTSSTSTELAVWVERAFRHCNCQHFCGMRRAHSWRRQCSMQA
jgi:hypothetical protein